MSEVDKLKRVMPAQLAKGIKVIHSEGISVFGYKLKRYIKNKGSYGLWMKQNEKDILITQKLEWNPLISVVVPVYNVADNMLRACIESVLQQTYQNWELCLVDDCSTMSSVRSVLESYESHPKIKIRYREKNGHISQTTNDGIKMASGEFVGLMDCDDVLAVNALYEMTKKLNECPEYDFIYSDEDKLNEEGTKRSNPFFKPDWSPDTFMSYMYTCHFSIFRKSMLEELGGERVGFEGSQDYDLVLRLMEKSMKIGHVPKILYHWRMRKESTANSLTAKPYIIESTIKAKEEALARRGLKGHLECIEEVAQYRIVYEPQGKPKVSIIIPSKDNYDVVKQCIQSIKNNTIYDNYEIIIVDNGSKATSRKEYEKLSEEYQCRYVYDPKEFNFSYMCNKGAAVAEGEYLLFLNDDIEIPNGQEKWLSTLLGQAQISYTGAVGAKLIYPGTNLIQHTGVINLSVGPGHAFHGFDDSLNCYWGRNILDYNYSVVTGACLLIDKTKYAEVGGFDETFPIAYNDVDICFKLVEHHYFNVVRNDVKLYHHESISRGKDETTEKAERLLKERNRLYHLHPYFVDYDPCYNPNLTKDNGDFTINLTQNLEIEEMEKAGKITEYMQLKDEVEYSIEAIVVIQNEVRVKGWAFVKEKNNKKIPISLLLIDHNKNCRKIATTKRYRNDIGTIYKQYGKVAFSGFECKYNINQLEKKQIYEIALLIENKCVITDEVLEI